MTCIYKIILAMVVVIGAVVLAKPRKHEYDDGLHHSDNNMENFLHRRAGKAHLYNCKLFFIPIKIGRSHPSGTKNDLICRANIITLFVCVVQTKQAMHDAM